MKIHPSSRVLLIGDSITDCGRQQPVGTRGQLGHGYASLIDAMLQARHPELNFALLNTGVSGNRVIDLEARWQRDVLDLEPGWLSVMIGINDVWRQFDQPWQADQVNLVRYRQILDKLLQKTRPALQGLILMTPFFIEPLREDPMRALMDKYGQVVKELAAAHDAILVDTQAAFDSYLTQAPSQTLAADRVHPNLVGHMLLADAWYRAVVD